MPLPKGFKPIHIEKAVGCVEKGTTDLIAIYVEPANVFSAIVGIFGAKGLDALSPDKKLKHPDVAQQRFPDLSLNGKLNPPPARLWNPKAASGLGPSGRTMTIRAGTSSGAVSST